jgi:FKBP-type peptidyl-prolyl cis-trans isomerase FkpA
MKRYFFYCLMIGLAGLTSCNNRKVASVQENDAIVDTLTYSATDKALMDSIDAIPGVKRSGSGLRYVVVSQGDGERAAEEDTIVIGYRGLHADGSLFWENECEEFSLKGTIKGFCEGVGLMPVGSKYNLYIPSALGYGHAGIKDLIAPDEPLIYEVTLLGVKKKI